MSFYFDDDDDFYTQAKSTKKEDNLFFCSDCGGQESYLDAVTGILTCTVCYTQSQMAPSQLRVDIEDAVALAARGSRGGQLIETGNRTRKRKRPRKKLEEHDSAVRLPCSIQCIQGVQEILEESTSIVCKLAGQDQSFHYVLAAVKNIWEAYLLSWKQGADYFGRLYPDVRFSFRDQFLDGFQRSAVSKTLSYMAGKRLKQEITAEETNCSSQPVITSRVSSAGQGSNNLGDLSSTDDLEDCRTSYSELPASPKLSKMESERSQIVQVVCHHLKHQKFSSSIGRKEAALMLPPSMTMVVAILVVATTPIGITTNQILVWIGNGSLPLLNGFSLLRDKEPLKPITRFFNLPTCPSEHLVDRMVRNLHVACGFKQRKIILNTKTNRRVETDSSKTHKPGHTIIPAHVPVIAASLVSDLGFCQQVLNYALSLMGKPIVTEHPKGKSSPTPDEFERLWLPPPLKKARLDLILDVNKILAVIIVALKLIPGWESMSFDPPNGANTGTDQSISNLDVPKTAHDFQFLRIGYAFDTYLDFVEMGILSSDDMVMPAFAESVDTKQAESQAWTKQDPQDAFLISSAVSSTKCGQHEKRTHKYLLTQKPSNVGSLAWQMAPPLGPLLEYITSKTATNSIEILEFVAELDEEVVSKCKKYKCEL